MSKFTNQAKIVVVGLGLIGASFAMALRSVGYSNICGIDTDARTMELALAQGIINDTELETKQLLAQADITILAIYPWQAAEFLRRHLNDFAADSLVLDTSGIKTDIIRSIREFWRSDADFVAIHQMAGREKGGIDNACDNLFINTNFIIIKQAENEPENIAFVKQLAEQMRVKGIYLLTAAEHDKIIAYTSHLNHLIAVGLVNAASFNEQTAHFIGGSFRDVSRVALINGKLWSQLLIANKEHVLDELAEFQNQLNILKTAIQESNTAELEKILGKANANRSKLCK